MANKATLVVENIDLGSNELVLVTAPASQNPEDAEAAEKDTLAIQTSPIMVRVEDASKYNIGDRLKLTL